jgi:hypothetical protein
MAKLKVYTLGNNGFVGDAVRKAISQPEHVRQARMLISARTKADAIRLLEERRNRDNLAAGAYTSVPAPSDPEFRQATGNDVNALRAAGLLAEPDVLVLSLNGGRRGPVARVGMDGVRRLGVLDGDRLVTDVPKGN